MPSRSSNPEKLLRSPFRGRNRQTPAREAGPTPVSEPRVGRITGQPRPQTPAVPESELGETTYKCGCGLIFQAPVLTSISCPYCGDAQAW